MMWVTVEPPHLIIIKNGKKYVYSIHVVSHVHYCKMFQQEVNIFLPFCALLSKSIDIYFGIRPQNL
jgi:hypothetical protein